MFASNATCVVMIIQFSYGRQSTDDVHILLLEPKKIREQNPDSIDSIDMLSFWCFKVHQFGFQIIFIDEHDHWHYSNSSHFIWEYRYAIWWKYIGYDKQNRLTESTGDGDYSFNWWFIKNWLLSCHWFHVCIEDESNPHDTWKMVIHLMCDLHSWTASNVSFASHWNQETARVDLDDFFFKWLLITLITLKVCIGLSKIAEQYVTNKNDLVFICSLSNSIISIFGTMRVEYMTVIIARIMINH
jgi:hypothetical protein